MMSEATTGLRVALSFVLCASGVGCASAQGTGDWLDLAGRARGAVIAVLAQAPDGGSGAIVRSSGSAFAISGTPDSYYLVTAAHVLPVNVDQAGLIEGSMWPAFKAEQRKGPIKLLLKDIERTTPVDLAVLVTAKAGAPLVSDTLQTRPYAPRVGEAVAVLGHSAGKPSELLPTTITGEGPDGTYQLAEVVTKGFSGAPVVDRQGNVVCIVRGGIPVADVPPERDVMGKAICTPVNQLLGRWGFSPFSGGPSPSATLGTAAARVDFNAEAAAAPLSLVRSINVTKDDHPVVFAPHSRNYDETVKAPPGYQIIGASFEPWSLNKGSFDTSFTPSAATLKFRLTSGPSVDRYRGWIKGKFTVTLVRQQR